MRIICWLLLLIPFIGITQEQDSTVNESSVAIFPAISFAPETSLQIGAVGIWALKNNSLVPTEFLRQSTITPYVVYTLNRQSIAVVNLDYYFPKGQNIDAGVRFFGFPDAYFGVGNDTDPEISEQYTNRFFQIEGTFLHPIDEKLFLGAAFDAHFTSIKGIEAEGLLERDSPVGVDGGNLLGIGPAMRYDTRNYTLYPTKGIFVSSRLLVNKIGDFDFSTLIFDARKYITIFNEDNVLAFQIRTQFTGGTSAPFFKLPQLGGDARLRGITNGSLYRESQMMYSQFEYRRPLFWRLGITVFGGIGDVAEEVTDFNLQELKYIAGMGGRFLIIPEKKLNLRLDLGVARGGQYAIYFGVSEAF